MDGAVGACCSGTGRAAAAAPRSRPTVLPGGRARKRPGAPGRWGLAVALGVGISLALVVTSSAELTSSSAAGAAGGVRAQPGRPLQPPLDGDRAVPEAPGPGGPQGGRAGEQHGDRLRGGGRPRESGRVEGEEEGAGGAEAEAEAPAPNRSGGSGSGGLEREEEALVCRPTGVHRAERCSYLHLHPECAAHDRIFNNLQFHYCALGDSNGMSLVSQLFLIMWAAKLVYFLVLTSKMFFYPALERLNNYLGPLPQDVAGVTLLAVANGTPDLIMDVRNLTTQGKFQPDFAIGSAIGSTFATVTVGLAAVVLSTKTASYRIAHKQAFLRDTAALIGAIVALLGLMYDLKLDAKDCAIMFSLYLLWVGSVLVTTVARRRQREKATPTMQPLLDYEDTNSEHSAELSPSAKGGEVEAEPGDAPAKGSWAAVKEEWREKGAWGRMVLVVHVPMVVLLKLTMPVLPGDERYQKPFATLMPIMAPLFVVFGENLSPRYVSPAAVLCIFITSLMPAGIIHSIYKGGKRPPASLNAFNAVVTFVLSIVWMDVIAGELVDVIYSLGKIWAVSDNTLGVLALGGGNSLVDLVNNTVTATNGNVAMALAASFAAPVFNLLFSLGLALLIHVSANGSPVYLQEPGKYGSVLLGNGTILLFVCTLFVLISVLFFVPVAHRWKLNWKPCVWLLVIYVAVIVLDIMASPQVGSTKPPLVFPREWAACSTSYHQLMGTVMGATCLMTVLGGVSAWFWQQKTKELEAAAL